MKKDLDSKEIELVSAAKEHGMALLQQAFHRKLKVAELGPAPTAGLNFSRKALPRYPCNVPLGLHSS